MGNQFDFEERNYKHNLCHGGSLRQKKLGRKARPLSTKDSIYLVFKANMGTIRGGLRQSRRFALIHHLVKKYARYFYIKIDKFSVQNDHIHLVIRAPKRAKYQDFFRVFAGQIAQQFQTHGLVTVAMTDTPYTLENATAKIGAKKKELWKFRRFTRVVKGNRAYKMVLAYVELNELEALNLIPYRKERLKGLSREMLERLWNSVPVRSLYPG